MNEPDSVLDSLNAKSPVVLLRTQVVDRYHQLVPHTPLVQDAIEARSAAIQ
jgi:hypothetical protein